MIIWTFKKNYRHLQLHFASKYCLYYVLQILIFVIFLINFLIFYNYP